MPLMFKALLGLLLAVLMTAPSFSQEDIEQRKIEYLIAAIADLHGAHFVRNGSEFDAQRAAEHLRFKFQHGCTRVVTAENFVADCATGSSITGAPYLIRFSDGKTVEAASFLREKLATYPKQPPSTPAPSDG
jgi:hypothetical protein